VTIIPRCGDRSGRAATLGVWRSPRLRRAAVDSSPGASTAAGRSTVGVVAAVLLGPELFGLADDAPFVQVVAFRPMMAAGLLVLSALTVLSAGAGGRWRCCRRWSPRWRSVRWCPGRVAGPPPPAGSSLTVLSFNVFVGGGRPGDARRHDPRQPPRPGCACPRPASATAAAHPVARRPRLSLLVNLLPRPGCVSRAVRSAELNRTGRRTDSQKPLWLNPARSAARRSAAGQHDPAEQCAVVAAG